MGKTLTQEEAKDKTRQVGGRLIGMYLGSKKSTSFICPTCNTVFNRTPNCVWNQKQIYCIPCSKHRTSQITRLTAQEVCKRLTSLDITMIDSYAGSHTPTLFECQQCSKPTLRTPNAVFATKVAYCDRCGKQKQNVHKFLTQTQAEIKSLLVGCKLVDTYVNCDTAINFECLTCKQKFLARPTRIWSKTKRCAKCIGRYTYTQIEATNKAKEVGCELVDVYINKKTKIKFKCLKCNSIFVRAPAQVFDNHRPYCPQCNNKQRGISNMFSYTEAKQKSLDVNIQMVGQYYGSKVPTEFICPQCNNKFSTKPEYIWSQETQSCGNCCTMRNSVMTSKPALLLDDKIQKLGYLTLHNYTVWKNGRFAINTDIALWQHNIAVELDSWYWHGHKQKADKLRLRKLHRLGWKTLQIKTNISLPNINQLKKSITDLINGAKQRTITIKSEWGTGNTRFPIIK